MSEPGRYGTVATLRALLDSERLPQRLAEVVAASDGLALLRVGPRRLAVVADPRLAWSVLTAARGTSKGRGMDAARPLLGESLLTAESAVHRAHRKVVQPAFSPARLQGYAPRIAETVAAHAQTWRDGARLDLSGDLAALTLAVVGRTLLGDRPGSAGQAASRLLAAIEAALTTFPRLMRPGGTIAVRLPTPIRRAVRRVNAELDDALAALLRERTGGQADDVLGLLLAAGDALDTRAVRDELLTLVVAGHETTAVALTWVFVELARHPEVLEQVRAELAGVPLSSPAEVAGAAVGGTLPLVRAVLAEALRLHPPVFTTSRELTEPTELAGQRLPRGTVVVISPYALQRDPRSWAEPELFRPGRWLDAGGRFGETVPGQPRGGYLPFGAGARVCIGGTLAVLEATVALATLLPRFSVLPDAGAGERYDPAFTLRPRGGLPVTLQARQPNQIRTIGP